MKKIAGLGLLFFCAGAVLPLAAIGAPLEQSGLTVNEPTCYIQTQDGSFIDLDVLCGSNRSNASGTVIPIITEPAAIPLAGYTCDDFATQPEAQWHYVHETAPRSLDDDGDGMACEYLPGTMRIDGQRIATNLFTNGLGYELLRDISRRYYLRIFVQDGQNRDPQFSTRSFARGDEAMMHAICYYDINAPGVSDRCELHN